MKVIKGRLEGILLLEPVVFGDQRGFFIESYSRKKFEDAGVRTEFVQDNHSLTRKGGLRGLHYQLSPGQEKLVRVSSGEIFDVVVDVRKGSPTFGQWEGFTLSAENKRMLFVPAGFAHGFCVLSEYTDLLYKCSCYYSPKDERGIMWDDPDVGVEWPVADPVLSDRDRKHPLLRDMKPEDLF